MFELYNMSGDPDDLSQLMNFDNTKAHILIRLSNPNNIVIKTVKEKITEYTTHFPAEITIGGYAMIMADFAGKIINGQILSLLFALVTVFILLAIIFKSIKGGLIGSIPLAVSILITFGFMGFSGIALDAATALLSSIMIGVGVDFTIQYLWRYNAELMKGNSAEGNLNYINYDRKEYYYKCSWCYGRFFSAYVLGIYFDKVFRIPGTFVHWLMPHLCNSHYTGICALVPTFVY